MMKLRLYSHKLNVSNINRLVSIPIITGSLFGAFSPWSSKYSISSVLDICMKIVDILYLSFDNQLY